MVCFSISRTKTVFGDAVFFLLTSGIFCAIMIKSAERGKGCDMYRHTFRLVGDEEISVQSKSKELPTFKYGDLFTFVMDEGRVRYTIPIMSVLYIETEKCEEE